MRLVPFFTALGLLVGTVQAQPVASRSALVIGVGQYGANTGAPALDGVRHDMDSAQKIARAMGIAPQQIRYLRDQDATKERILQELQTMGQSTSEGGRSFVYFSGHGTRYWDPKEKGCVEGLLAHDGQAITNSELAQALRAMTKSADKVVTMVDACHSGSLQMAPVLGSRSISSAQLKPRFSAKADESNESCSRPSNLRTRSLLGETTRLGALQENVVHITSARPEEVSFEEPGKGGVATQAVRDCLLGQARDADGSGAITLAEVQQCAQDVINQKLQGFKDIAPHHLTITGNRNLIPVAAPQALITPPATAVASAPIVAPPQPVSTTPSPVRPPPAVHAAPMATAQPANTATASPPPVPVAQPTPEPQLASLATLRDIEQQRDPRLDVQVTLSRPTLTIGKDALDLTVRSNQDGYLYLVLLGSDRKSFYVLFPNGLDGDNRIEAGKPRQLPRPDWRLVAAGPAGVDHLLVMVTATPRRIDQLGMTSSNARNPFTFALNDMGGRTGLVNFLVHNKGGQGSERFGASLLTVREVP